MKGTTPPPCHDPDHTAVRGRENRSSKKRLEYGEISRKICEGDVVAIVRRLAQHGEPSRFQTARGVYSGLLRILECRRQQLTLDSQCCCEP